MNFDVDKIGRTIANLTIHEFAYNYRGYDWGYNGPGVITRTFQKVCNTNVVSRTQIFLNHFIITCIKTIFKTNFNKFLQKFIMFYYSIKFIQINKTFKKL